MNRLALETFVPFRPHGASRNGFLWFFVIASLVSLISSSNGDVQVANQRLYVDGHEFYVKGIVYTPAPLGIGSMQMTGYGGGGFCSAKLTPYDEWKSACYDADFFDGSGSSEGRVPSGPSSWFSAVWDRDFPLLKDMGVNTVKLQSLNPLTKAASEARVGTDGIVHPYGKSHIEFLDACKEAGIMVMAPLVSLDASQLWRDNTSIWQQKVSDLVSEIGSHPALLAFYVGSDWGLESPSQETLLSKVNQVFDFARTKTSVPLTHCVSNLPSTATFYGEHLKQDFVCANVGWDGPNGISEFLSSNGSSSGTWASEASAKGWPIVIGEIGIANMNSTFNTNNPNWFNLVFKQTLDSNTLGVTGAFYYEYVDQPYSGQDWKRSLGANYLQTDVSGILNSTQENIFWADTIHQKNVIYDSIKSGSVANQQINYHTNVWDYFGRAQGTIGTPTGASPSSSATILAPYFVTVVSLLSLLAIVYL